MKPGAAVGSAVSLGTREITLEGGRLRGGLVPDSLRDSSPEGWAGREAREDGTRVVGVRTGKAPSVSSGSDGRC